jgi:hypothetical protein
MPLLKEFYRCLGGVVLYKHDTPNGVKLRLDKASGTIELLKTA